MRKLKVLIGRVTFWLGWPVWYFYLRSSLRTRVLIVAKGKVLLVKGWHNSQRWSLPGGGVHNGERTSSSAIREVYEETGISLSPRQLKSLGFFVHNKWGISFQFEGFVASLSKKTPIKTQKLEIFEAKWLSPNGLNDENTDEDTLALINAWQPKS